MKARALVFVAFVLVLSVPFVLRAVMGQAAQSVVTRAGERLVIVSPHVEQIQYEFDQAFSRWYQRVYKQNVWIDWRQPGGTSEIVKQIEASFDAAARKGLADDLGRFPPGTAGYDLFFGGGSFEHSKMREVKTAAFEKDGTTRTITYRMGQPAGFSQQQLDQWFGENKIGVQKLYDPDQYWIGTALSGFGIVYNRELLRSLNLPEPTGFRDLCDFRYVGMLAMTDGRLSGSVTTSYESILNNKGWDGWRTLRELAANARYFASAATKAPVDVGQGEAAAGLSIDFYGRGQAQFLARHGEPESASRVGYVDPRGSVYIDADPVSMLNGAARPDLARHFIEFCLTDEAQLLWQLPALSHDRSASNPAGAAGEKFGPQQYELRRMPVRREMYASYGDHFVDKADPFEAASDLPSRGWRSAIAPMMAAFGIDTRPQLVAAWKALNSARSANTSPAILNDMEAAFYALPKHRMRDGTLLWPTKLLEGLSKPARDELTRAKISTFDQLAEQLPALNRASDGKPSLGAEFERLLAGRSEYAAPVELEFNADTFKIIRADTDSWKDPVHGRRSLIAYTEFFRQQYQRVIDLAGKARQ